jgi:hypothetical protein
VLVAKSTTGIGESTVGQLRTFRVLKIPALVHNYLKAFFACLFAKPCNQRAASLRRSWHRYLTASTWKHPQRFRSRRGTCCTRVSTWDRTGGLRRAHPVRRSNCSCREARLASLKKWCFFIIFYQKFQTES